MNSIGMTESLQNLSDPVKECLQFEKFQKFGNLEAPNSLVQTIATITTENGENQTNEKIKNTQTDSLV